ncbi:MAG: polysaccharide biosynthesis C-terminal domain-containing protein [Lachnospiraceae bacterium]|nr:polysaccharide biosynthesis C-terminal domain-containing protein [Lachnospiraceae bacterium]
MASKSSRTKKTLINTSFSIASQMLTIVLSFVLRTAFIKILGNQYTGVASVFTTILTMLSLSELGFGTAVATALYQPLRENDQKKIQQLMDFYKKAYRVVALFIFVVGVALTPFLRFLIKDVPDIKESIAVIYLFYIIKTAASYLMIYKTTLLRADQKLFVVKKLEMVCQIIRYVIEVIVLLVFREYMTYLVIEVVATITQNYVITRRAEKEYPHAFEKPEEKLPREKVVSLFKDVKGLSMYKLSHTVGNSVDTMLISGFINTSSVTLLGNYSHIKGHVQKVLMQFYTAVIPSVGNLAAEKKEKKQLIVFNRLFYISFLMVNFCSVSLFVLFKPFITLWLGEEYVLGQPISFVIAFDFFLYILLQAVASFRTANGLFVKGQYRPFITAVVNVILSVILIRRYGIFGTILATVFARFLTQWYDPYLLYKYIFKDSFARFYVKYWIYIGMFVSGAFITDYVMELISTNNMFFNLIIGAAICVIIPNVWVLLLTHRTKEFAYVKGMMKGVSLKNIRKRNA